MIRHMKSPQSPKFFRCGLRAAAATMALLLCSITFAQNYPTKPVRMVIGYPPGGASDIVGRVLAGKIQESLGQSVIVENRPGANANIGAEYVAKSPADGYTLGFGGGGPLTANGFLYKKLNYNPARDFVMVATVAKAPLVLAVNPSVGATTLRDLVALFKSKPGAYSYGTPGGGSPQHLTTAMFMSMTGTQLVHIPYKGATPMLNDLVGGQVHIGFDNLGMLPYVKSGRLLALGVAQGSRSSIFPDVPTFAEAGVPGIESFTWYGVFAPLGTPAPVVERISAEVRKAVELPEVQKRLADLGAEPMPGTSEQMKAFVEAETAKWGKVIREFSVGLD